MVTAAKKADSNKPAPKKKRRTPEEHAADLEAQAAAIRVKALEKDKQSLTGLKEKLVKLQADADKATGKVADVNAQIDKIERYQAIATPTGDDV